MRPRFTDLARIQSRAKKTARTSEDYLERWWSNKYNLPTNHKLLTDRTIGDLLAEMYGDLATEMVTMEGLLPSMTGDERVSIEKRYRELAEVFGETGIIDEWEAMMEQGVRPDLSRYQR